MVAHVGVEEAVNSSSSPSAVSAQVWVASSAGMPGGASTWPCMDARRRLATHVYVCDVEMRRPVRQSCLPAVPNYRTAGN